MSKKGLQADRYRCIVNAAKRLVFENCRELLKYAVWEEKPDVILFPEKHKEKCENFIIRDGREIRCSIFSFGQVAVWEK